MISTTDAIKHTPGPWVWRNKSGTLHRVGTAPYAYGDLVLAPDYEHDSGVDTRVSDADAALIAAAPDLLAALKTAKETIRAWHGPNAWEIYDRVSPEMRAINDAIAKSEGRS